MIITKRSENVIDMEVENAVKPVIRHGVFCGRERICDIEDEIPADYFEKFLVVRFRSGLILNCRGDQVGDLSRGRQ